MLPAWTFNPHKLKPSNIMGGSLTVSLWYPPLYYAKKRWWWALNKFTFFHTEAETEWLPYCRRHLKRIFLAKMVKIMTWHGEELNAILYAIPHAALYVVQLVQLNYIIRNSWKHRKYLPIKYSYRGNVLYIRAEMWSSTFRKYLPYH